MKPHEIQRPRVTVLAAFQAASGINVDADLVSDVPEMEQAVCAVTWLTKHARKWLELAGVSADVALVDASAAAQSLLRAQAQRSKAEPVDVPTLWSALARPRAGMEAAARILLPTDVVDAYVDLAQLGYRACVKHATAIDPELAGRLVEDLMTVADACVTEMVTGEKPAAPAPEPDHRDGVEASMPPELPQIDDSDLDAIAARSHEDLDPDEDLEREED